MRAAEAFIQSAIDAPLHDEATAYYRQAGGCLTESGEHARAGAIFLRAEDYTLSALAYRRADMLDLAIHIIQTSSVESDVAKSIVAVARLQFFRDSEVE